MKNKVVESYLQKLQKDYLEQVDVGAAIGGAALGIALVLAISKSVKYIATTLVISRACKRYKTGSPGWKICENKVKNTYDKKKIVALNSKVSLCNKSKQPEKCKVKLKEKINKLQANIKKREVQIKQLQTQMQSKNKK